ncbi:hypothetical protein pkur_cds_381 [Pandoravirus kuranda]|uniref:Uncharacterized protein n=1 Tax=Pandoravirus kuranda TaxID=3019033 RepID=A0AA95ECK7_9VIRU|nr:hypothetical protein pkur_cds_381 [Pandoravirus kuranda]
MSATMDKPRYEHIIQALRGLGNNAAAEMLIRVFEEQRQCAGSEQAAPRPADLTLTAPSTADALGASMDDAAAESRQATTTIAHPQSDGTENDIAPQACAQVTDVLAMPNPPHVHIDTAVDAPTEGKAEKPADMVPSAQSHNVVDQAQEMPRSHRPESASLPTAERQAGAAAPGVADAVGDYVTLAQFVAFLGTLPGDTLVDNGGLIRVAKIDFDIAKVSAKAVTFGRTIKSSHTHDLNVRPIALTIPDFNAISLNGDMVSARRLYEALTPLAAVNPSAGVCVAESAIKLEWSLSFATDDEVRFHNTTLNPAHALPNRDVIRDAIALASRCVESGISCGEVLSMIARRIPTHAHMSVLHLVALKDRVVAAKQIGALFEASSFTHDDVPADLFVAVEPFGECPTGFKDTPHISMGRLPMTWDELEGALLDEEEFGDLSNLPRCASGRPWALPPF